MSGELQTMKNNDVNNSAWIFKQGNYYCNKNKIGQMFFYRIWTVEYNMWRKRSTEFL